MSITVIVARELTSPENIAEAKSEGPLFKEVELPGVILTGKTAKVARTQAFGQMVSAMVADGWRDAFWVPGGRKNRGKPERRWSAKDTRRVFGNTQNQDRR